MNKRIAGIAAALLLVPGLFALSGCGKAAQEAVEQGIEQGTGGDVEIDDDGVKVTDEEGNEFAAGDDVELPSTWPEVVPTPEGTLVFAGGSAADGASSAVWQVDGSVDDAITAYSAKLSAAGFSVGETMDLGTGQSATYTGNGYMVAVIVGEGEGGTGTSFNVSVTPEG
jgi:hypothetical protein